MLRRVVLDTTVLVSGAISAHGPSARLIDAVRGQRLDLVVCPILIAELAATIHKPRLRRWVPDLDQADAFVATVAQWATHYPDPTTINMAACRDPNDAYLLALGVTAGVDAIVSGDKDLTVLGRHRPPVLTPRQAIERLDAGPAG